MWIQVVYFLHNCCELLVRLFSLHRKIIDFMKTQGLGDQTNVNVGEFYFPLFICMSLCCCFFLFVCLDLLFSTHQISVLQFWLTSLLLSSSKLIALI